MPPITRVRYVVDYFPAKTPQHGHILVFVAKRAYQIEGVPPELEAVEEPEPLAFEDALYDGGDPMASSIEREGDFAVVKPRVDAVFNATAYAPKGRAVESFEIEVRIGGTRKSLRITGPRRIYYTPPKLVKQGKKKVLVDQLPQISAPEPLTQLPIRYEHAFGGVSALLPADEEAREALFREAEASETGDDVSASDPKAAARASEQKKRYEDFVGTGADAEAPDEGQAAPRERRGSPDALDGPTPEDLQALAEGGTRILPIAEPPVGAGLEPPPPVDDGEEESDVPTDDGDVVLAPEVLGLDAPVAAALDGAIEVGDEFLQTDQGDVQLADDKWVEVERARKAELDQQSGPSGPGLPSDATKVLYPFNPVGKGYVAVNDRRLLNGIEMPQVEDPQRPILPSDVLLSPAELLDKGIPAAGLGAVGKAWLPRGKFAGLDPDQKEKAQDMLDQKIIELDPEKPDERKQLENLLEYEAPDFDPRWNNGAATGLDLPNLLGNEQVVLTNLTEEGEFEFALPGDRPDVTFDRGNEPEKIAMRLDTFWMDVEERRVELTWRGHLKYGGPDEMGEYPHMILDVEDKKLTDFAFKLTARDEGEGLGGDTMILTPDVLEAARKAEVDADAARAEAAAKEEAGGPKFLWTIEDEQGTRREELARDRDVLHSDDEWIEALKSGDMVPEELTAEQAEALARRERKEKKDALVKKLEEIRKREAEEALAASKKKRRKK